MKTMSVSFECFNVKIAYFIITMLMCARAFDYYFDISIYTCMYIYQNLSSQNIEHGSRIAQEKGAETNKILTATATMVDVRPHTIYNRK